MAEGGTGFDFYGINIVGGFNGATVVGLVSVLALILGYAFGKLSARPHFTEAAGLRVSAESAYPRVGERQILSNVSDDRENFHASLIRIAFLYVILVFLVYLGTLVVLGGGFGLILNSLGGRSAEVNEGSSNVPVLIPALPVAAAAALAVCRIVVARRRALRASEEVYYWSGFVLLVVPPAVLGNRRFLLPTAIALLLGAAYSQWNRKVGLRLGVGAGVGLLALMIFPFVRSAGSRTGRTDLVGAMLDYFQSSGLKGTLDGFFLSYDTEMFNYVSFLWAHLITDVPLGYGRGTFGDALLAPVPSALAPWPSWSNYLLQSTFGVGCAQGVCPVPSLSGVLLYDLHLPGVILGFLILGAMCSKFEGVFLRASGVRLTSLLVFASFTPIIIRGNSVAILWIAVNVLVATLLVLALIRWSNRQSNESAMVVAERRRPRRMIGAR